MTEKTNEIKLQLPDASTLRAERDSMIESKAGRLNTKRQPKYLHHSMGLVGAVLVIAIILAVSLSHEQKTYNGSKEVLQSMSNANGMRLTIIARGPLVSHTGITPQTITTMSNEYEQELNSTMNSILTKFDASNKSDFNVTADIKKLNKYVDGLGILMNRPQVDYTENFSEDDSEQVITVIAIPMKDSRSKKLMTFKMHITTEHSDGSRYNISLVNNKASYLRQNLTSSDTIVESCITQDLVPPVDGIAYSILDANVLEVDEDIGLELVGCNEAGKIVHATWSGHQYLYCIENEKITHIAGNHLTIDIEYLDKFTSKQYAETITVPDQVTSLDETMTCPKLDLTEAGNYFDNLMSNASDDSRRLLDITKVEEEHWWLNHNLKHPSVRRLTTQISSYFVTQSAYSQLLDTAKLLNCYHYCIYSSTATPSGLSATYDKVAIASLKSFVKVSSSVRKLKNSNHAITLPRDCSFIHGAGFFYRYLNFKTSHREAWGNIHANKPCYCKEMKFMMLNTYWFGWYDRIVISDIWYDFYFASNRESTLPVVIKDTIIFTHFTSSLTFGAMLESNMGKLDSSSRWITIQTPITDTIIADQLPVNICTQDNIEKAKQVLSKTQLYSSDTGMWYEQKQFMFKVISICSPDSGVHKQLHWLASIAKGYENSYGSPATQYLKASKALGKHVNAALCGMSARGMLSTNSQIIEMTKFMGFSPSKIDRSDGITTIDSCMALKSLKLEFGKEEINFGSHYTDKYYLGNIAQSDIPLFADSKTDIKSQYRKWVTHLNLIQDA